GQGVASLEVTGDHGQRSTRPLILSTAGLPMLGSPRAKVKGRVYHHRHQTEDGETDEQFEKGESAGIVPVHWFGCSVRVRKECRTKACCPLTSGYLTRTSISLW